MAEAANTPPGLPPEGRGSGHWVLKVSLSLGSLALILGLLELGARLLVPSIAPTLVRPGFYDNPLPLVTSTGGQPGAFDYLPEGPLLPEAKRPGETRIVMLGESSVAGSPLGVDVSPPAMMKDLLSARFPDRDITVVNMGRPASIAANVYYYLLFLRRFSPDYVVFYMGGNDNEVMPGEQCLLGSHPVAYAAWRSLVEHSWLLWLTRTYGSQLLWKATGKSDWYPPRDCPVRTFTAWADLLVGQAVKLGAHVVIATPVVSAARGLEPDFRGQQNDDRPLDDAYRKMLACVLTEGCDFPSRLRDALAAIKLPPCNPEAPTPDTCSEFGGSDSDRLSQAQRFLEARALSWETAARRWGADYIPFHRLLELASPGRILGLAFFMDRQHLSPSGYYYLAAQVSERIAARMSGQPVGAVPLPGDAAIQRYVHHSSVSGLEVEIDQLVRGWFITAVPGLRFSAGAFVGDACAHASVCREGEWARIALGWLRVRAGLPSGLPPDQEGRLATFKPRDVVKELSAAKMQAGPDHHDDALRGPTPGR